MSNSIDGPGHTETVKYIDPLTDSQVPIKSRARTESAIKLKKPSPLKNLNFRPKSAGNWALQGVTWTVRKALKALVSSDEEFESGGDNDFANSVNSENYNGKLRKSAHRRRRVTVSNHLS